MSLDFVMFPSKGLPYTSSGKLNLKPCALYYKWAELSYFQNLFSDKIGIDEDSLQADRLHRILNLITLSFI